MPKQLQLSKWNEILIEIFRLNGRKIYCQLLGKRVDSSLGHLRCIVKNLERHKLIEIKLDKHINQIRLTLKGQRVANNLVLIKEELK